MLALLPDLLLVEVRGVAIAVLQHRKQRRQSLARRSRNSRPQGEAQRNLGRLPLHFRCSVSLWPAEAQGETSVSLSLTLYGNSPEPFGHSVSSLQEIPSAERAHPRHPVGQQPMPAAYVGLSTLELAHARPCTPLLAHARASRTWSGGHADQGMAACVTGPAPGEFYNLGRLDTSSLLPA